MLLMFEKYLINLNSIAKISTLYLSGISIINKFSNISNEQKIHEFKLK